jgi:hypothetical protein
MSEVNIMAKDMNRADQMQRSAREKNEGEERGTQQGTEEERGPSGEAPRIQPTGQAEVSGAGQKGDEKEAQRQKGLDRGPNTSVEGEEPLT